MPSDSKIIVALDFSDSKQAIEFASRTSPELCKLKVGKELFTSAGPDLVNQLVNIGFDVFLDLKFHDIPNTVNKACRAAADLGVWMLNVHSMGGETMMRAAREGVDHSSRRPLLIAVTVLTSLSATELRKIGIETPLPHLVATLTRQALDCGLDGVVCSAQEAAVLRGIAGEVPLLVTPGIRPLWASSNDQKRIVTPRQAILDGASYLVIGRPITQHAEPAAALLSIQQSISEPANPG